MNAKQEIEATLEISFPKALLLSVACMSSFVVALIAIGIPLKDPLLIGFLIVMAFSMTFVFAGCICFVLRCKIGLDGLRPAMPGFYQRILLWNDITGIRKTLSPFYVVAGRGMGEFCILPRPFLLKKSTTLKQLIERYAPSENIVRKELAA